MRQVDALTSHIDIVPTMLGLAGVGKEEIERIRAELGASRPVPPFAGADFSAVIRGETDIVRERDANEMQNLLKFDGAFPTPIADLPAGQTKEQIVTTANKLHEILTRVEAQKLAPWP